MDCLLADKCIVKSESAYDLDGCCYCIFNADACLQNNFQFNGVGEEPTDEELDEASEYAE